MRKLKVLALMVLVCGSVLGQTEPVKFYIKGTGLNRNSSPALIIGDNTIYNTATGRGLRLTILNKADQTIVSGQTYDCYGNADHSESLAAKLNAITNTQIGILTSYDAWEGKVTVNLDNAFLRLGLSKAAATINGGSRRPYAAIFTGATNGKKVANAIEVSHTYSSSQPYAEINGFFYKGSFVASATKPNALFTPQGDEIGVITDYAGRVGIGTFLPSSKLSIYGSIADSWNSGLELNREDGGKGWIVVDAGGMKFRTPNDGDSFYFRDNDNNTTLFIQDGGSIGIGTTNPGSYKLAVEGVIGAHEIKVTTDGWADFVFDNNYQLPQLQEVEAYIKENNHLPNIPSEQEVLQNGIALGEMDAKLLRKIEELTLYTISQEEKLNQKDKEVLELKAEAARQEEERKMETENRKKLEERLARLEALLLNDK